MNSHLVLATGLTKQTAQYDGAIRPLLIVTELAAETAVRYLIRAKDSPAVRPTCSLVQIDKTRQLRKVKPKNTEETTRERPT